jgi:transcriptional regulator with XRE-family HTH domain
MKDFSSEKIKDKLISLIEAEYESDAAFERALGLPQKTVNNWRRDRSKSFMNMLPRLSEIFSVSVSELMDMPLRDGAELSDDEIHLLSLYRSARVLPGNLRGALRENLENTINLYVAAYKETEAAIKDAKKRKK